MVDHFAVMEVVPQEDEVDDDEDVLLHLDHFKDEGQTALQNVEQEDDNPTIHKELVFEYSVGADVLTKTSKP